MSDQPEVPHPSAPTFFGAIGCAMVIFGTVSAAYSPNKMDSVTLFVYAGLSFFLSALFQVSNMEHNLNAAHHL